MNKKELERNAKKYFQSNDYKKKKEEYRKDFKYLKEFRKKYTINKIKKMKKEEYCLGTDKNNSFCYWVENKLSNFGEIKGTYASVEYVMYCNKNKKYVTRNNSKYFKGSKNKIMSLIRNCILDVISTTKDIQKLNDNKLPPMFKAKIYYIYNNKDEALPIYSKKHLMLLIELLELDCPYDDTQLFNIRQFIISYVRSMDVFNNHSLLDFMLFVYSNYGFKKEFDLLKSSKKKNTGENDKIVEQIQEIEIDKIINQKIYTSKNNSNKHTNHSKREKENKATGRKGEAIILEYEKSNNKGNEKRIKKVSDNNKLGYDIVSIKNGKEIHIEVKASRSNNLKEISFYLTFNEFNHLMEEDNYYIYYIFNIYGKNKKLMIINKNTIENIEYNPVLYKINGKVKLH